MEKNTERKSTGRKATTNIRPGLNALSVGMPNLLPPKGWTWMPLLDVAGLATGHTPSRRHPEYWNGDIRWMNGGDARIHDGGIIFETMERVNQKGIDNSAAEILPEGTVCLSRTGASIGYVVILGTPMATNQGFVNFVCGEKLLPKFLQYLLLSELSSLIKFGEGTAYKTIYFPEVKAFHICIPNIEKQKEIILKLDYVLGILEEKKRKIFYLIKQNKERIDFFQKHWISYIINNEIEKHPQKNEWGLSNLESLCTKITDGEHLKPKVISKGVPFISAKDLKENGIDFTHTLYVEESDAKNFWKKCNPEKFDILIGSRGTIGRICLVNTDQKFCMLGSVILLKPLPSIENEFLLYFLRSSKIQSILQNASGHSVVKAIYLKDIKPIDIPIPPKKIQQQIIHNIKKSEEKFKEQKIQFENIKQNYESQVKFINHIKSSILNSAFSGKLGN